MRGRILSMLAVTLALAASPVLDPAFSAPHSPGRRFAGGVFLVRYSRDLPAPAIDALNRQFGTQRLKTIPRLGVHKLAVPAGRTVDEMVTLYRSLADVEFAEPDFIAETQDTIPNDLLFALQWGPPKVKLPAAWDLEQGSTSIVVAVVDTGVDCTHPDLAGRCVSGFNTIHGQKTEDDFGHGTHVAGILGALTNNTAGVAGANWQVSIMPVKVLNSSGSGTYADVSEGIVGAADRGAKVINLSLGGCCPSDTMKAAVDYAWGKGVFLACAAGNGNGPLIYPAAYPSCTAVGATDQNDQKAWFSSYGTGLAVTAPGVAILSTVPKTGGDPCCTDPSGYKLLSGTSMATPHVAGLAALLFDHFPGATNADIRNQMEAYATDLGTPGWDQSFGYGRIDAYKAVANPLASPVSPPPSILITRPANGATVTGIVNIQVSVTGAPPFSVEIRVWNRKVCTVTTSSVTVACDWDSTKGNWRNTVLIKAFLTDATGASTSTTAAVTVQN